ncbi:MAG: hypothetical protein ACRC1H_02525 [Caldilineaceae bacterium]
MSSFDEVLDRDLAAYNDAREAEQDRDEEIESRASALVRQWLANPGIVADWIACETPTHAENAPVPVDAAWLIPLDGNHEKLMRDQPTWVLHGLVWAGADAQVQTAALLIRERFHAASWDEAVKQATADYNEEQRLRESALDEVPA